MPTAVNWFIPLCHRAGDLHILPKDVKTNSQLGRHQLTTEVPVFPVYTENKDPQPYGSSGRPSGRVVLTNSSAVATRGPALAPVQLGHEPVAVAAVDRAHVLDDLTGARLRRPLEEKCG